MQIFEEKVIRVVPPLKLLCQEALEKAKYTESLKDVDKRNLLDNIEQPDNNDEESDQTDYDDESIGSNSDDESTGLVRY